MNHQTRHPEQRKHWWVSPHSSDAELEMHRRLRLPYPPNVESMVSSPFIFPKKQIRFQVRCAHFVRERHSFLFSCTKYLKNLQIRLIPREQSEDWVNSLRQRDLAYSPSSSIACDVQAGTAIDGSRRSRLPCRVLAPARGKLDPAALSAYRLTQRAKTQRTAGLRTVELSRGCPILKTFGISTIAHFAERCKNEFAGVSYPRWFRLDVWRLVTGHPRKPHSHTFPIKHNPSLG